MRSMRLGMVSCMLAYVACSGPPPEDPRQTASVHLGTLRSVDPERELLIRDLSVVDDPQRTLEPCRAKPTSPLGPWTFGHLMKKAALQAGAPNPEDFVLNWLRTWETDQMVNGYLVRAKPWVRMLTDRWLNRDDKGQINLSLAPFRLLAIVNRIDLWESRNGEVIHAGEGRLVFDHVPTTCRATERSLSVIFEYKFRAASAFELDEWAQAWHALGNFQFGTKEFNEALEAITERFTVELKQLRTNEFVAQARPTDGWEFREFTLSQGALALTTTKQTPDFDTFNGRPELIDFINHNESEILAGEHVVPEQILGGATTGGRTGYLPVWHAPGTNPEARHLFALRTCGGCHGVETGTHLVTDFSQVLQRVAGEMSRLSGFLTGITVADPVDSTRTHSFNDLERRRKILGELLALNSTF